MSPLPRKPANASARAADTRTQALVSVVRLARRRPERDSAARAGDLPAAMDGLFVPCRGGGDPHFRLREIQEVPAKRADRKGDQALFRYLKSTRLRLADRFRSR